MVDFLPRDLWQQIFSKFGDDDLEQVSLVCKDFLSISSSVRHTLSLTVTKYNFQNLSKFLERFSAVEEISLTVDKYVSKSPCSAIISSAILQIARSALDLKSLYVFCPCDDRSFLKSLRHLVNMKNLQALNFSVCDIHYKNLHQIGDYFPNLKELVIRNRLCDHTPTTVNDEAVELLISKLKYLEKLTLSSNLSDKFIVALSSNCHLLKQVIVYGFTDISGNGIGYLLRHCPNLVSISMSNLRKLDSPIVEELIPFTVENSIAYAKKLQQIDIRSLNDAGDSILLAIANVQIPLKKISFFAENVTHFGLSSLLHAHGKSLSSLTISALDNVTDDSLKTLFKYLENLTEIALLYCESLTSSTFVNIVKSCPLLERIQMIGSGLDKGRIDTKFGDGANIKHLRLFCEGVSDRKFKNIAQLCPKLQTLELHFAPHKAQNDTTRDIVRIFRSFQELRVLRLHDYNKIKICTRALRCVGHNLEEIYIFWSKVNDGDLAIIAKMCTGLRILELVHCYNVTTIGVNKVIDNCRCLKRIRLYYCNFKSSHFEAQPFVKVIGFV